MVFHLHNDNKYLMISIKKNPYMKSFSRLKIKHDEANTFSRFFVFDLHDFKETIFEVSDEIECGAFLYNDQLVLGGKTLILYDTNVWPFVQLKTINEFCVEDHFKFTHCIALPNNMFATNGRGEKERISFWKCENNEWSQEICNIQNFDFIIDMHYLTDNLIIIKRQEVQEVVIMDFIGRRSI